MVIQQRPLPPPPAWEAWGAWGPPESQRRSDMLPLYAARCMLYAACCAAGWILSRPFAAVPHQMVEVGLVHDTSSLHLCSSDAVTRGGLPHEPGIHRSLVLLPSQTLLQMMYVTIASHPVTLLKITSTWVSTPDLRLGSVDVKRRRPGSPCLFFFFFLLERSRRGKRLPTNPC